MTVLGLQSNKSVLFISYCRLSRGFSRVRCVFLQLHVVKCCTAGGQDGVVSLSLNSFRI